MNEFFIIAVGIVIIVLIILVLLRMKKPVVASDESEKEILQKQAAGLSTDLKVAEEKARSLGEQLQAGNAANLEKEGIILDLNRKLSALESDNKALESRFAEYRKDVEQLREKFTVEFRNLANDILEEKTKKFTEQNRTKLEEILKPLGEKIREFEKRVEDTYDKESKQRFSLEKEIRNLAEQNIRISEEAKNLTTALKSDTKKQGNWGELVLERVLESSGLVKDQEYFREVSTKNEEGDTLRPDVIVRLPENKHIIIDSKVSLNAYTEYVNAETPEEKEKFLKLHLISIRNHVKTLSEKKYDKLPDFDTPDYVLLFIPIESSFSTALQSDIDLFNFAWEKNVVIVSPTTLLATLRTIASIWKHEKQELNSREIARQTGELYDKFVGFLEDLEDVGARLDSAKKAYEGSMNKLKTGKGNIIRRAEKIKELGVKPGKALPKNLLEQALESDETETEETLQP